MTFEIWVEGFAATGDSGPAWRAGTVTAETFKAACQKQFKGDKSYDIETNTYWRCRLFDNETAARKSFG